MSEVNPAGLNGMEFLEYSSPKPDELASLFERFGFKKVASHKDRAIDLYRQNGVNFVLNRDGDFANSFCKDHGPSICATGFRVNDVATAMDFTCKNGARKFEDANHKFKAIYGIGDSLVYFVDNFENNEAFSDFEFIDPSEQSGFGLTLIDHMTNNVPKGDLDKWAEFYEKLFNFREIRFFDIKGAQTGLLSRAMRSPCGKITIPINEPVGEGSQIQEYLDEYNGSGIQHVALLTEDIVKTVTQLKEHGVEFLDVPDTYYETLLDRLPNVTENVEDLQRLKILVDGDSEGYLLQIFTKNMIGPIFFEIIQRKNHHGFGEGNFQALFDAIEEDQRRRGYLK